MKNLLVEEARALILRQVEPLAQEEVSLFDADGRVLGELIDALRDQPPFAASAMDGWAIHEADARTPGARLTIIGESAAGRPFDGKVGPGEAVRIFTGAAMPKGADAVVIQEDAERHDGQVTIKVASGPHAHTRSPGIDFKLSDQLLEPGVRLDPWRIGLAAASGRATLRVRRRPKVAILSTGEEIVSVGVDPGKFQIFDSGSPALASLVRAWGGEAVRLAPAADDVTAIADAVRVAGGDVVVTIGGASVGDYDLVKPALAALGLELIFESIRMRPGKPTWSGRLADGRLVLGLPGNPSSALVCAQLFLRPLLMALQGADATVHLIQAQTTSALPANGPREHWMRAKLSHTGAVLTAEPMRDQDSSLVKVFAESDALIRRPIEAPPAEAQSLVEVLPLERLS
jgi:molybdopterin molybdotransferase